jgi:hypothetical protein
MEKLWLVVRVLGFVANMVAMGWLRFLLGDWCYFALGRWFVELLEGMSSAELAEAMDDWLWRNGRIDNMSEVGLGYFGKLVVERAKDTMKNIASSEGPIAS